MNTTVCTSSVLCRRPFILLSTIFVLGLMAAAPSPAQERMYFPAVDNVTSVLVQTIRAETVRIDMAAWYLTDGLIISALLQKHAEGVPIRLIGDRGSIFEIDRHTKNAFYRLANAGVPIRLRFNPAWYPEIVHWKATIFAGQNLVTFGSANYTPFELAPSSSTNYKDETVLFTDDSNLVNAFRTQFDRMWNDTTREPMSRIGDGPYFLDWNVACAREAACADYATLYPEPAPMHIDTARLEADHPMPADMTWGQGPIFNNRLAQEIENESNFIDFVIYRLTVSNITDALLARHSSGVPVRLIIEPQEYRNRKWSEFWLTHAYVDKLWAAGVPIKKRVHNGLTHMKMLVTSAVATNASSNLAASWQRDHNYFVPAQHKPAIYGAMKSRFDTMWNDSSAFAAFMPEPPDAPVLASPAVGASGVSTTTALVWNRAAFATRYDVYLGASPSSMAQVATVNAALVNDPPETYSWQPSGLDASTTYYWKVVSRTNASLSASSSVRSFTTGTTATTFSVSPTSIKVSPAGGSGKITITGHNGASWTAISSASWVEVSPASGAGSSVISYTAAANGGTSSRSATISIEGALVTITQSASPPSPHPPAPSPPAPPPPSPSPSPPPPTPPAPAPPAPAPPPPPPPADAPRNVQWAAAGSTVSLTWDAPTTGPAPLQYFVQIGLGPGRTDYSLPTGSALRAVTYRGVPNGTYYVRVHAMTASGVGPASNEVAVALAPAGQPAAPVNLSATVAGSHVTLRWVAGPSAVGAALPTHYVLEAGFTPGASDAAVTSVGAGTVAELAGVPRGVYYVRVRAANGNALSPASNEVTVTVR